MESVSSDARQRGRGRRRSALVAVVLSGLGPGAGHAYAGVTGRGALLVALFAASALAWTTRFTTTWGEARLWALPPTITLLAILVDAGRQARRAPNPFPLGALQRWWSIVVIIVVTGFLLPTALGMAFAAQADLVEVRDESMTPWILPLDQVVIARRHPPPRQGDVVALEDEHGARILRRVIGEPGRRVAIRGGRAWIDGQPWLSDPVARFGSSRAAMAETRVPAGSVLVMADARRSDAVEAIVVPEERLLGLARYVLLPGDLDPLRVGEPIP